MKKLVLFLVLLTTACTDPDSSTKVLSDQGYTNIKIGGYAWLSCSSKDDLYSTEFTATSPGGKTVAGAVCKGIWKGSTIRFN